jgi:hypothetical protein
MTNIEADVVEPDQVDAPELPEVDPLAPDADAPYGYMIDPDTQERRAKKRPGRQRTSARSTATTSGGTPSLDDLRAAKQRTAQEDDRSPDAPRARPRGKRGRTRTRGAKSPAAPVPPFRAGPIASGINRLYARGGKILRELDYDVGSAIIATTRRESDDDVTVGDAWEEIAKVNPRIRAFLLKAIQGGAWSGLVMAHAPILLALFMKDAIRKRVPFMKFVGALLDDDDDGTPSRASEGLGGLQAPDVAQMMQAAMDMMSTMGAPAAPPRSAGGQREPVADVPSITILSESA